MHHLITLTLYSLLKDVELIRNQYEGNLCRMRVLFLFYFGNFEISEVKT